MLIEEDVLCGGSGLAVFYRYNTVWFFGSYNLRLRLAAYCSFFSLKLYTVISHERITAKAEYSKSKQFFDVKFYCELLEYELLRHP